MRLHHLVSTAALIASLAFAPAHAQRDWSAVEIETTDLGDGIYMLTGAGGNIGASVGEDGIFLVDDQFAPLTERILAALAGISDRDVVYVINTHWHGDHTGGNENLAETGTTVVAHDNVRIRMMAPGDRQSPPDALPVITYSDTATFHLNGEAIRALHVHHAHTDGDSIIVFDGANIIHAGDLLFNNYYPFVDLTSGGTVSGLIAALEKIHEMADEDTQIIPGHGVLTDRQGVMSNIAMLKETRSIIEAMLEEGMSEDEIKAAQPVKKWDDAGYGSFFITSDRWIGTLIADLTGEDGGI